MTSQSPKRPLDAPLNSFEAGPTAALPVDAGAYYSRMIIDDWRSGLGEHGRGHHDHRCFEVILRHASLYFERGGPPHGLKREQNLGPQEIWEADQIYTYWLRYGDIKEFVLSRDTRFLSKFPLYHFVTVVVYLR